MVLHFLVSWNEQRLASLFSLMGPVLGRIGDDDKSSLQLPIRREDFPQLIERGLLSQESSIDLATGIPQTAVPFSTLLLTFGSLLTFFFSRDCAGSRAPYCGRK